MGLFVLTDVYGQEENSFKFLLIYKNISATNKSQFIYQNANDNI